MLLNTFNQLLPFIEDVTQDQGAVTLALENISFRHEIFNGFYLDYTNCPFKQIFEPLENGDAFVNSIGANNLDDVLTALGQSLYCLGSFYLIINETNTPNLIFNIARMDTINPSTQVPQGFKLHLVESSISILQETGLPYLINGFSLSSQANVSFIQAYATLNPQQFLKSSQLVKSMASKIGLVPKPQDPNYYTFDQSYKSRLIADVSRVFEKYVLKEMQIANSLTCMPLLAHR